MNKINTIRANSIHGLITEKRSLEYEAELLNKESIRIQEEYIKYMMIIAKKHSIIIEKMVAIEVATEQIMCMDKVYSEKGIYDM